VKEATIMNTTVKKSHPKKAFTAFQKMFHTVMLSPLDLREELKRRKSAFQRKFRDVESHSSAILHHKRDIGG
jgi:hypothetical protein